MEKKSEFRTSEQSTEQKMEDDKLKTMNDIHSEKAKNYEGLRQIKLVLKNMRVLWSIIFAAAVSLIGFIVYFFSIIPWIQLEFKSEIQKLIMFSKIVVILFRGDTKGDIAKNALYSNLYENAHEVHERIANVDWLYWTMLFLPFYIAYALVQESFLKLRENVRNLKEDCKLKHNFINWQGSMHVAMHQRIAELRVEVKTLNSMLDAYRQNTKEKDLHNVNAKKSFQAAGDANERKNGDMIVFPEVPARASVARKNKSDSLIEERREPSEAVEAPRLKARPKTEESRYSTTGASISKKCLSPAWLESSKRLQERSKEILKSRVESARRAKEAESNREQSTAPENQVVSPTERRIARSKFTSRRSLDESKSTIPKNAQKTIPKRPEEEYKILAHQNVISELKARNKSEETSVSAVDLLQTHQNINKITPKKRSLSEAAAGKDPLLQEQPKRILDPREITSPINFENDEDIVSKLGLEGVGKVKSYTEIFKKKVHVPKSGKAPEITIEGSRRWCF